MYRVVALGLKLALLSFARYLSASLSDARNSAIGIIEQGLECLSPSGPHFADGSAPSVRMGQRGAHNIIDRIALGKGGQGSLPPPLAGFAGKGRQMVRRKF
jgi:hypothetical protein